MYTDDTCVKYNNGLVSFSVLMNLQTVTMNRTIRIINNYGISEIWHFYSFFFYIEVHLIIKLVYEFSA